MALIVADRVQETTNSTGTGAYTLGGAVPGFQTFASEVSNADTVYYSITDNVDFEVGLGTYASSGGTITRTTVFTSSNSNNAVNWGVGTKNIFLTYPADKAVIEDASNNVTIGNNLVVGGTVDGRDVATDGTKLDFVTVTQAVDLDQMETDIAALANGMVYKSNWDASAGSFPGGGSAQTGWFYYVSVAGTVNSISFAVGDNIVAITDNASTSTYASNWSKHDQTDAVQAVVGLTGSVSKSGLLSALNVEDGADVTDTTNVTSAGALMDSEVTNLAQVKAFSSSDYATAAQGTLATNALPKAGGTLTGNVEIAKDSPQILWNDTAGGTQVDYSAYANGGAFSITDVPNNHSLLTLNSGSVSLAHQTSTKLATTATGIDVTGNATFADNGKAIFGAGSDLQIYHDGSNSYIKDAGTGRLTIQSATDFLVANTANTQNFIYAQESGYVRLYHSGSTKLETTSTGIDVTGTVTADGINSSGNFAFTAADGMQISTKESVVINIDSDDNDSNRSFSITSGSPASLEYLITATEDSGVNLYYDNAAKLATTSTGIQVTGNIANASGDFTLDVAGDIILDADGADVLFHDGGLHYASIRRNGEDAVFKSIIQDKDIIFRGNDGGVEREVLRLDMSDAGTAIFNHDIKMSDNSIIIMGAGEDIEISSDGTNGSINAKNGNLTLDVAGEIELDSGNGDVEFKKNGVTHGFISNNSDSLQIYAPVSNKDILFKGSDNGSVITALTLDMSDAGRATFNSGISVGAGIQQQQNTLTMSGGTSTIDLASANNHYATMTANTTVAFSNKDPGRQGNIIFKQDGTGGRSFTLPAECKTPVNGAAIVQATGAFEISVLSYYVLDSNNILVNYIGDFA